MSRLFRLYEKKRGGRRTGSKTVGSFGEALFFGIFFVVGCGTMAYMLVALAWPEWRANRQFEETTCVLVGKRVGSKETAEGEPVQFRPEFALKYEAAGRAREADGVYDVTNLYSSDEAGVKSVIEQFEVGKKYPCWYDPLDPQRVVLVRGYSLWLYVSLLIPLSFIVIGGGRMIYELAHWNASEERRSVLDSAAAVDWFEAEAGERHFPNVPDGSNQTNSPGTKLAYRLPISATFGWTLFAAMAACILWNALVAGFVVMVVRDIALGEPDWVMALTLLPFAAGGVWLIVYFSRQILVATGVGPTRLEISDHPLVPGMPYEVFLSQAGRLNMRSLEVWLACDERATYHQGTDTRTEIRRVYEYRCFVREDFEIPQGLPFESRCQVQVPEGAMHSFLAIYNEVSWKLIVRGHVKGRPKFEREFQIVVHPALAGQLVS